MCMLCTYISTWDRDGDFELEYLSNKREKLKFSLHFF